jgi:hypothetical protein
MSNFSYPYDSSYLAKETFDPLHVINLMNILLSLSDDDAFLRSDNLFTRSFLTEICSKFSISTEINKFNRINWPMIRREKKKKVEANG